MNIKLIKQFFISIFPFTFNSSSSPSRLSTFLFLRHWKEKWRYKKLFQEDENILRRKKMLYKHFKHGKKVANLG